MTKENKRLLSYIKYQMKGGVTFDSICRNFGYVKKSDNESFLLEEAFNYANASPPDVSKIKVSKEGNVLKNVEEN